MKKYEVSIIRLGLVCDGLIIRLLSCFRPLSGAAEVTAAG